MPRKKQDLNVFVAEGCRMPKNPNIIEAARKIGEYLGKHQYVYLQGCSEKGLMGVTYKEFAKYNTKAKLVNLDVVYMENVEDMVGEHISTNCLNSRLKVFADNTDVIVVLPGANGTLQEFTTFLEINRMYRGAYKIIVVNIDGFFDNLFMFYRDMEDMGLAVRGEFEDRIKIVTSADSAIEIIKNYKKKTEYEKFKGKYKPKKL